MGILVLVDKFIPLVMDMQELITEPVHTSVKNNIQAAVSVI
jgi:hypothetical protein